MEEQVRESLKGLNDRLEGQPYRLEVVRVDDFELLEKNARFMTNEMFRALVANVKRDGGLTSTPFCIKTEEGKYRVLSGNHRVMAAKEAGLSEVLVMCADKNLSHEEQVAIQLSHNAIEGKDDPVILRDLWEEIRSVELKIYSGLDDKILKELESVQIPSLQEVDLDYRTSTIVFLPEEQDRLKEVLDKAIQCLPSGKDKEMLLARFQDFDRLISSMSKAQGAYNIKNAAVSLMLILDVFEAHQEDLAAGWEEGPVGNNRAWVPIASILGGDVVPAEAARVIKKAVDRMMDKGEIKKRSMWQCLELWAADYLAS